MAGVIETIVKAGSADIETYSRGYQDTYAGGYSIAQDPQELAKLVSILRNWAPYACALSIGPGTGGADRILVENVDIRELVVIDDGDQVGKWQENRKALQIPVHPYMGKGGGGEKSKSPKKFLKDLGLSFNMVGIDGGHSPKAMAAIWALIAPYLARGCVAWFHDIQNKTEGENGAAELWFQLRKHYPVLLETRKTAWGIGAIQV